MPSLSTDTPKRRSPVTACGTLSPMFVRKVDMCRRWVQEVLEAIEGFEDVTHTNVSEVCNRSYDGFIAFTDGGFDGLGFGDMGHAHGSGSAPQAIQPYIDSALKDIEKDWDKENPEHTVEWCHQEDDTLQLVMPGFVPSREREMWQQKYWEFEDANMSEGGTYFYKVRVLFHGDQHSSESGEPEALFCVGINTDFEYGRDHIPWLTCYGKSPHCTKWLWEKTIKIKDLRNQRIDSFISQASKALANA